MGATKLSLSPLKGHDRNTANKHAGSVQAWIKIAHPPAKLQVGAGVKTTIRQPKDRTTIGPWSVRCLHACRKVKELIHDPHYWWALPRSDGQIWRTYHRWGTLPQKIWYCRLKTPVWVALIVQKGVVGSIIRCTPISSRLTSIWYSHLWQTHLLDFSETTQHHSHLLIQVYAPTSDHEVEEVEQFYKQLDSNIADSQEGYNYSSRQSECQRTHINTGQLVSWYFERSQPQRITSRLKTMFHLSPIYSAHKPSNHKLSKKKIWHWKDKWQDGDS